MKTYYSQNVKSVNLWEKKDWGWDQVNHSTAEVLLWGWVRNKALRIAEGSYDSSQLVERLQGVICC